MPKQILLFIFVFVFQFTFAQQKMRSLNELINIADPGWPLVKEWIDSASNKVEILPVDTAAAKEALLQTQVTTRSPMGAIIYMTGGLLIDNGWIRILGSGNAKLTRTLPGWNMGKSYGKTGDKPSFLLIADDVVGGFFLLNGGSLGKDLGKVYYFSPDNLEYEALNLTYTEFLQFCFHSDLNDFYKGYRWNNWKEDVSKISGDYVFNFLPPLWTKEGQDVNKASKKAVPAEEQYQLNLHFRKELGIDK